MLDPIPQEVVPGDGEVTKRPCQQLWCVVFVLRYLDLYLSYVYNILYVCMYAKKYPKNIQQRCWNLGEKTTPTTDKYRYMDDYRNYIISDYIIIISIYIVISPTFYSWPPEDLKTLPSPRSRVRRARDASTQRTRRYSGGSPGWDVSRCFKMFQDVSSFLRKISYGWGIRWHDPPIFRAWTRMNEEQISVTGPAIWPKDFPARELRNGSENGWNMVKPLPSAPWNDVKWWCDGSSEKFCWKVQKKALQMSSDVLWCPMMS